MNEFKKSAVKARKDTETKLYKALDLDYEEANILLEAFKSPKKYFLQPELPLRNSK